MINAIHVDLNLLALLLEVNDTRSVSKAGRNIGLSQPAASNALARLRETLGDPLFVRGKEGMTPTAFTERIVPRVRDHLAGISDVLTEAAGFDPATSTRTFRLSLSGLGEQVFLPVLAGRVAREAPNVSLENISSAVADLPEVLASREADIAIGILNPPGKAIRTMHLFHEVYRAVGNPTLTDEEAAHMDLGAKRIILVAPSATYANDIESLLDRHGLSPNVSYRLRHFGALPDMIRTLDAIAIVPEQLADRLEQAGSAKILPTELPLGRHSIRLVWHRKSEDDPGCTWLRGLVTELFLSP